MLKRASLAAALVGGFLSTASANVFVYDVKVVGSEPSVINYRLLDAAGADVQIEVFGPLPATTVIGSIPGTAFEGLNQVSWLGEVDGTPTDAGENYGFRVVATQATGHSDWTQISDDNTLRFMFEYPRGGVAINNNPDSDLFGMIYVGNCRSDATAAPESRPMAAGFYAFYPDATDPIGFADTPATGNVDWTLSGTASPYRIDFGPDGMLYIPDWSDAHAGLWRAPEDLSGTFPEVLTNAGQETTGLVPGVHGSIAGLWLEMNGDDLDIYWPDEDINTGTVPPLGDGRRNYFKTTITPTTVLPIATPSTLVLDEQNFASNPAFDANIGIFVNDTNGGIVRDADGNFYVSNYRAVQDFPSLMKITADGLTMPWDSRSGGGAAADIVDPLLGNLGGLVLSPDGTTLYAGALGFFAVVDLANLFTNQTEADAVVKIDAGGTVRDIEVDPAGNVYTVSNVTERLKIFSPGGANAFTFESSATLAGGSQIPTAARDWNLYQ